MKKLKLAFLLGPYCLASRKFDLSTIWDDPQGLTGSEFSFFRLALGMASRGHEVHIYAFWEGNLMALWDSAIIHEFHEIQNIDSTFDAAILWNETEPFRNLPKEVLKIVSYQINSFEHCNPDSNDFVDIWSCPSEEHKNRLTKFPMHRLGSVYGHWDTYYSSVDSDWRVIPHGCDLWQYDNLKLDKVPGRVIYASSPDRGLHWLLQEWPKIKKAVPHANLRIFYKVRWWLDFMRTAEAPPDEPSRSESLETKHRAFYINESLKRLENQDVQVFDSVSKNRLYKEMAEAEILAYPCDTCRWSEGFSITLLEGCAARACPVTTGVDALSSIYKNIIPVIDPPVRDNIHKFSDLVIEHLLDSVKRQSVNEKARKFAEIHTWDNIMSMYENLIIEKKKQ